MQKPAGSADNDAGVGGKRRCNAILLMSDQHRALSMGAYGSHAVQTPHLDAFARESVQFERAYCQYPQCVAARQSLLTGQYPSRHGAYGINLKTIDPKQWTLPQAFRQAGYRTALIGHPHANENGFDDNRNSDRWYDGQPAPVKDTVKGVFFGFDYLENARTAAPLAFPEEYLKDDYTWKEAVRFLKEARSRETPFFLWVTFCKPHPPFNPPPRFWDAVDPAEIELPPVDPNRARHPFWPEKIMTAAMQRNYLHGYYACIAYMDWCMGHILAVLRDEGYFDDSIIAYVSDHGENGDHHGAYEKHCFYEPAVRVPLLVRAPDSSPRRVPQVVEIMDLAPTFTELCGVDTGDHDYDAVSLGRLMAGDAAGAKNRAISEYYQKVQTEDGHIDIDRSFGRMLVEDGFKCCLNGNMIDENSLFNLNEDPDEFRNLWHDPVHRERRERMVAELRQNWRREGYPYESPARQPRRAGRPSPARQRQH